MQKRILNKIQKGELEAIFPKGMIKEIDDGILLKRVDSLRSNINKANNEKYYEEKDDGGQEVQRLEIAQNAHEISEIPMNFDEKNFYDSLEGDEIQHMSFSREKSSVSKIQTKKKKDEIVEFSQSPLFNFKGMTC